MEVYFTERFEVQIVDHIPADISCGILATASLTIITTNNGDFIRIIDMCNTSNKFKPGQMVKIAPKNKPPFGLDLPPRFRYNDKTKRNEMSVYNQTVLLTTWGHLLEK